MEIKKRLRQIAFKSKLWLIKTRAQVKDNSTYAYRRLGKAIKTIALLIKKATITILKGLGLILDDILLLAGIGLVFYGVFLIYEPAGFIFLGLSLVGLAYLVAHKREIEKMRR